MPRGSRMRSMLSACPRQTARTCESQSRRPAWDPVCSSGVRGLCGVRRSRRAGAAPRRCTASPARARR
eukprot:scaffold75866_cov63-Phaeocystis_antarctica.AAC.1